MDVCIKRDHNTFSTTIHHKKTFTGLYTKWDSFTPRKYKVNLIRTLTYRCLRICSKSTLLQSALSDLLVELSLSFLIKIVSTGRRNLRLSTKPVAGIVMLFTSAKLKEDYMTERLSTSKLSLKLVTPLLLLSIRFPLVTTSNGTILRS